MFNIIDAGYGISECLLMAILGDIDSLNSKLESNWSYMKIKAT